jgi:hypothetical protein
VHAALRERLGNVTGAGGEIEDDIAGFRGYAGDERRGDRRTELRDGLSLGLPADGGRIPALPDFLGRVYAVTPLNCGRMSLPYASSVSSWPFVIR